MLSRLLGKPGASDAELALIRALVEDPKDPRSRLLVEQVARARTVKRTSTGDLYVLELPETTEDLLVELPSDVTGEWARVREASSGAALEFRVEVPRSGIFGRLVGRSPGGTWPRKWEIAPSELQAIRPLALPGLLRSDECLKALSEWLGPFDVGCAPGLEVACNPGADSEHITNLKAREAAPVPGQYAELLKRTDGLTVAGHAVLGTKDAFVVTLDREKWWVIAAIRGADHVVIRAVDERVPEPVYLWPSDAQDRDGAHLLAIDLKAWLRDSFALGSLVGVQSPHGARRSPRGDVGSGGVSGS